jgi:transposase-like protein
VYSFEDRIQAVRLYLKLGKRIRATIRQLGYPTKNSLKAWHREYEQCHDLRIGYVRATPRYSAGQKQAAVAHYLSHDRCAAATLRALGYPSRGTLAAWIAELCPEIGKRIAGRVARSVPRSQEATQAAVIELCTREDSAHVVAQKAGVSRPMLYNWKNQLLGREVPASMKRPNKPAPDHERAELEQQVESLRRDILTKANELVKKEWASTCNSWATGRRRCWLMP